MQQQTHGRGEHPCPCTDGRFKLHRADVREIRTLLRTGAWTTTLLGRAFRVHPSHISNIKSFTRRANA